MNDIWCGWEWVWVGLCVRVSTGWFVRMCMFQTHSGGSLWQCVHVGSCVCRVVWGVCFSVAGICA